MTQRFKKAYDSLVKAFFEGTLAKGTCLACACGNIINDAMGKELTKDIFNKELQRATDLQPGLEGELEEWHEFHRIWSDRRKVSLSKFIALEQYKDTVNVAGYTAEEFAMIENAFENNSTIPLWGYLKASEQEILEDQYKGLCAVVDVLMEVDNMDQGAEEYKSKFKEHPSLQKATV